MIAKPIILFTTPRTGSTIICEMLYNIGKNKFNFHNCLHEYFLISILYKSKYELVDGVIKMTEFTKTDRNWCDDKSKEQLTRLELLRHNPNYMIKVFPLDLTTEIKKFITETYDIVYLERENIEEQFLSFLGLLTYNTSHHYVDSKSEIKSIVFNEYWFDYFLNTLRSYKEFKKNFPSPFPTILYEDFTLAENKEQYLINCLELDIQNYVEKQYFTIPTPYSKSKMDLIINKKLYFANRHKLFEI